MLPYIERITNPTHSFLTIQKWNAESLFFSFLIFERIFQQIWHLALKKLILQFDGKPDPENTGKIYSFHFLPDFKLDNKEKKLPLFKKVYVQLSQYSEFIISDQKSIIK